MIIDRDLSVLALDFGISKKDFLEMITSLGLELNHVTFDQFNITHRIEADILGICYKDQKARVLKTSYSLVNGYLIFDSNLVEKYIEALKVGIYNPEIIFGVKNFFDLYNSSQPNLYVVTYSSPWNLSLVDVEENFAFGSITTMSEKRDLELTKKINEGLGFAMDASFASQANSVLEKTKEYLCSDYDSDIIWAQNYSVCTQTGKVYYDDLHFINRTSDCFLPKGNIR